MTTAANTSALRATSLQAQHWLNDREAQKAIDLLLPLLTAHPDHLDGWDHLAVAYTMLDSYELADQAYERCYVLGGRFPETLRNAARNAHYWGKPERQLDHALRLLECGGELRLQGLRECAQALLALSRPVQALAACRQCLHDNPGDVEAARHQMRALLDAGLSEEALAAIDALPMQDLQGSERIALMMSRVESVFTLGEVDKGIALANEVLREDPDCVDALIALGFNYQYVPGLSVEMRRQHAERFADTLRRKAKPCEAIARTRPAHDGIVRVGLVCGDLRRHPVAFFMQSLLEHLQKPDLEFYVYDSLCKPDVITDRFRPLIKRWHLVKSLSDSQLARLVQEDEIDILMDLHGYTSGNRMGMMVMRPAPVQVTWLGYQGTSGLREIDYALGDVFSVPVTQNNEFTENVWRLPRLSMCYSVPESDYQPVPPPVLRNGFITFGCMNNPNKINDAVLALWSRVLAAVPDSRLLLRGGGFNQAGYRRRFVSRLQRVGIDPQRVTIERMAPRERFLEIYSRVDIALDPFPYSGITTTAEALWAGVPVLALEGNSMVWRMGGCFVQACGMPDWVAATPDEYVARAVQFAADPAYLATLRRDQRERVLASPLFDAPDFARHFEQALRQMAAGVAAGGGGGVF